MKGKQEAVNQRLRVLIHEALANWAFLVASDVMPSEAASPQPLEYMVRLRGQHPAILVASAPNDLGRVLAEAATGEVVQASLERDAFKELVNIISGQIISGLFKDAHQFQPFMPIPSSPNAWPKNLPEAHCAVEVEGIRLEIRVWTGSAFGASPETRSPILQECLS